MLPQNTNTSGKIYVNPNFKGQLHQQRPTDVLDTLVTPPPYIPASAHINPLFLEKQQLNCRPRIHMNPMFLLKLREQRQQKDMKTTTTTLVANPATCSIVISQPEVKSPGAKELVVSSSSTIKTYPVENRKIICKSRNRLIREPFGISSAQRHSPTKPPMLQPQALVVVNKRKLVRKPVVPAQRTQNLNSPKTDTASILGKSEKTKYKLDNRVIRKKTCVPFTNKTKRKSFVGRYALRRTSSGQTSSMHSVVKTGNSQSMNKKLQLLNINGLLYKSTRNKLQLKDICKVTENISKAINHATPQATKPSQGLTIFVKGTKYVMDPQKFKLTRVSNVESEIMSKPLNISPSRSRIYIGGFTYVSAPYAKNVLIRTTNHLSRAYVHNAKQKSLHVLTKHLVKSNIPCPIYQRLGKCAAFERGKCAKVHNKLQVAICSKFLRGECLNSKCLLSHDVSLSKMPVCKFFLQGVCVRNDCPYLHKKLSNNAEVCIEFLRGFCKLADKCNKRHEFVCPELERNGSCTKKTCIYCKTKLKKQNISKRLQNKECNNNISLNKNGTTKIIDTSVATEIADKSSGKRYFIGSPEEEEKTNFVIDEDDMGEDSVDDDMKQDLSRTEEIGVKKRPNLGILPAFIPLS